MSDAVGHPPALSTLDAFAGKSAGTMLREAREAAGLHVSAMAVSLKVPVKKLEALEADDLEQLPDAVFARALAATVCRSLKIDPKPVLARMPQLPTPPLKVGSQETRIRLDNRAGGLRLPSFGGLPRPVVYLTAVLLVGTLVVTLMPSLTGTGGPEPVGEPNGVAIQMVPSQASGGAGASPAPVTAPLEVPASAALTAQTAGAPLPAASSATPLTGTMAILPTAAGVNGAIAVLTTREASWAQVVDAAGLVHLRKTMDAGETARINGTLPLSVVIGRANAIDVAVRGKPFDLAPVTKDNVARFQIN